MGLSLFANPLIGQVSELKGFAQIFHYFLIQVATGPIQL